MAVEPISVSVCVCLNLYFVVFNFVMSKIQLIHCLSLIKTGLVCHLV